MGIIGILRLLTGVYRPCNTIRVEGRTRSARRVARSHASILTLLVGLTGPRRVSCKRSGQGEDQYQGYQYHQETGL
jgi:hypothetical protein